MQLFPSSSSDVNQLAVRWNKNYFFQKDSQAVNYYPVMITFRPAGVVIILIVYDMSSLFKNNISV